jgi:ferredoxin
MEKQKMIRLTDVAPEHMVPLPPPYDGVKALPPRKRLTDKVRAECDCSLDGFLAVGMTRPKTEAEEQELVSRFLAGLNRLLSPEDNWAFLQQLTLSLDHCAGCQTCVESCPIYTASGRDEVYRPTFRSEIFRRIVKKYAEGRRDRTQRHYDSPAARIGLPLYPLPSLRPGLPHGRGQRAYHARNPQAVQHGTGRRSQGNS